MRYDGGLDEVRADRVRQVYVSCESRPCGSPQRRKAARRGRAQAFCGKTKSSRPQAKTEDQETFRLGPRFSVLVGLRRSHLAGDFIPRKAFSNDLANGEIKAVAVGHILPIC